MSARLDAAGLSFEMDDERHAFARSPAYEGVSQAVSYDVDLDEERDGRVIALRFSDEAVADEAVKGIVLTSAKQGVFVAGDMMRGASLVVWAIADGRSCARAVDEYLMGESHLPAPLD